MHPQTPQDRRAFESPEFDAPARSSDRTGKTGPRRSAALSLLFAALMFAAIVGLIIVL
jgi:hypothetical protein